MTKDLERQIFDFLITKKFTGEKLHEVMDMIRKYGIVISEEAYQEGFENGGMLNR